MMKSGIETNQNQEATMNHIEVRCPVSLSIKALVSSLSEYAEIATKAASDGKRKGVRYEAYNRITGVTTTLDNIGHEGHV